MDKHKLLINLRSAFLSQAFSTSVSAVAALFLPKFLGVEEYGYLQLFIFYVGYTGLFHFGLNDGVYLIHGGKTMDELPKKSINSQLLVGLIMQSLFSMLIMAYAMFGVQDSSKQFVFVATSVMIVIQNASWFLGYVFQAINETSIYSFSLMVAKGIFGLSIIVLLIMRNYDFRPYIICYSAATALSLVYCLVKGRPILIAGLESPSDAIKDAIQSIRVGIKLLLANLSSLLIIGFARWLIDVEWGVSVFGQFSLSLQLGNFILMFLQQIAMVLFPGLRRSVAAERKHLYASINYKLCLLLPLVLFGYFPLYLIFSMWVPSYVRGLTALALILPICIFDGRMQILSITFFKVLRKETVLLVLNLCSLAISVSLALTAMYIWHNPELVILSAVVAIVVRSLVADYLMAKCLAIPYDYSPFLLVVFCAIFIVVAQNMPPVQALMALAFIYVIYMLFLKRMQRFRMQQ